MGRRTQIEVIAPSTVINGTGYAESSSIDAKYIDSFKDLFLKFTGSAVDVKVEHVVSYNGTDWTALSDDADDVASHTGTALKRYALSTSPGAYVKFRVTGNAGNGADTTVVIARAVALEISR